MTPSKHQFDGHRVRIPDVFDLQMGKTPSRKNPLYWRDGNHDWVSIADLGSFGKYVGKTKERINDFAVKESGIKLTPANTVLMSFKLSLGKTSITTEPVYTNEAIMAFINKGLYPVDTSFMYHQCRSKDWAAGTNAAVMGKTLNKRTLGRSVIFLPSLEEQEDIAAKLDFIDEQLQKAKDVLHELDSLVKSRFIEMFGDPVEENRWARITLASLCTKLGSGATPRGGKAAYKTSGIPLIRSMNVHNGYFESKDLAYIDEIQAKKLDNVTLHKGDVLLNITGASVARSCLLPDYLAGGRVNQHVSIVRCDPNRMLPRVLNSIFTSDSYQRFLLEHSRMAGATREAITKDDLETMTVPLPPLSLQYKFAAFVAQVDKSRFVAQQQIEKLQMLYDSLAQEYFGD